MPQVILHRVSFGYAEALFEHLDLQFSPGRYALVGPNGGGKSTLLKLLTGQLVPQQGHVRRTRCDQCLLCDQAVDSLTADIQELGLADTGSAIRLRARLRLSPQRLAAWGTLSPGERKRWQVAAALHAEPDLLALDEPTNHLDAEGRVWLTDALCSYRGIVVVVSHDRDFLDALCDTTLRLEHGKVTVTPGNYTQAEALWRTEERTIADQRRELGRVARQLKEAARVSRAQASAAERERSAGRRMKSRKDHDASCILQSNQAESAGRRLARQARAVDARRERVTSQLETLPTLARLGSELFADHEPAPKTSVLRGEALRVCVGEREVFRDLSWHLRREQRVRLSGPNGSGKTSFLEHIIQDQHDPCVLYLPQHMNEQQRGVCRSRWLEARGERRAQQMTLLAALGTDPEVLLRSAAWSEGELRKAALSMGLANKAHTLVLDEPTNHLDLPSIERLERLLQRFPGALLLATHDAAFARRVTKDTWRVEHRSLICV